MCLFFFLFMLKSYHSRENRAGHKWLLNKCIIYFPLHCNACETFLFAATGASLIFAKTYLQKDKTENIQLKI